MVRTHLLILGERKAIYWVLQKRAMAFSQNRASAASDLAVGDRLFIYSTRSAWHNPTRARGRVIGLAHVTTPVEALPKVRVIAGRDYTHTCRLDISGLVPYPNGVELAPLVAEMHAFPNKDAWPAYLRRPLLALDGHDATLIYRELKPLLEPIERSLGLYRQAARLTSTAQRSSHVLNGRKEDGEIGEE